MRLTKLPIHGKSYSTFFTDVTHCLRRIWAIYEGSNFDLTDHIYTQTFIESDVAKYNFLDPNIVSVFEQQPGQDITTALNAVLDAMDSANRTANMDCLSNAFYWGETDFRYTPRCQVQNYLLLVFSSVTMASMALKCTSPST
jgi:chitin synthase